MKSLRTVAVSVTCAGIIGSAILLWSAYQEKTTQRNLAELAKLCRQRADKGDAKAQYDLGSMYYRGQGVPQDSTEAVRWYRKAAEQGYANAQYSLGFSYAKGQGVQQDYAEAVRWCRKAAEQDNAKGQYCLGFMYRRGQGVEQDDAEAVHWYRKSAEQGYPEAQYGLGLSYAHGQGVPEDDTEAVRWYRKAADQGEEKAQRALELMRSKSQGAVVGRWATTVVFFSLALIIVAVPKRRWGSATWVPWALTSALCAAMLAHEMLSVSSSALRLIQALLGARYGGFGRVLVIALLAGGSATCAFLAAREAAHRSKLS